MKYKYKDMKSIVFIITHRLKVPNPPLGNPDPLKDSPPKISKKLSPQKTYHFKILQPFLKSGGVDTLHDQSHKQ